MDRKSVLAAIFSTEKILMGTFQWKELLAALALFVSILALATSFVTAYFTLLKSSILRVRFGGTLLAQSGEGGKLNLMPEIILHNDGARPIVVYKISCQLRRKADNNTEPLRWAVNLTSHFDPINRGTDTRFDSFPSAIFIGKGEVVTQRLSLFTKHQYRITDDDYRLELTFLSDGCSNKSQLVECVIRVNRDDVEFFEKNPPNPEKRQWKNLRFQFEYGEGMNCYITGSQM